jgi:hypothetical protein
MRRARQRAEAFRMGSDSRWPRASCDAFAEVGLEHLEVAPCGLEIFFDLLL